MTECDYAAALIEIIERAEYGTCSDGLHLGPTDLELVAKALRTLTAISAVVTLVMTSN